MDACAVCHKELSGNEGIMSSTGVVVCSEDCKERFVNALPNRGRSPLVHYSRVTGYITPVEDWNRGKLQEHRDRKLYDLKGVVTP